MMNRKSITTKDWVLAVLIFGGIFALGIVVIADYANTNDAPGIINNDIAGHYNQMQSSLEMTSKIQNASTQPGGLSFLGGSGVNTFVTGLVVVFNVLLSSLTIIPLVLMNILSDFGIDTTTGAIFLSILAAGAVILVLYAIFNASKMAGRA